MRGLRPADGNHAFSARAPSANCPSCHSVAAGRVLIFGNRLDFFPKSEAYSAPSRAHQRGGSRSSRTSSAGCDGRLGAARDSFVRTNGTEADVKACGPGLPTLRSNRVVTSRVMTGAIKPGPRGATVLRGRPAIGRPQGWRETRPRLRRLKALTPSARRSVGLACARSWTEREKDALAQFTAKRRLGSHFWPRAIIVLRMTISLRMQAISATFGSFPLAISR